jgi:hypothetical protein
LLIIEVAQKMALIYVMRLAGLVWFRSERWALITLLTLPVSRLARTQENLELGMLLVRLWEQETGLDWSKTATELEIGFDQTDSISYSEAEEDVSSSTSKDNPDHVYPKSLFTGNGLELARRGWKKKRMASYRKTL